MSVITITSDLGLKDYYVASIKGAIYSQHKESVVVDISHEIPKFDIAQTAFVLKNCYSDFPKGSIHIIGVRPNPGPDSPYLAVEYEGHYFISTDNGVFSLLFDSAPSKIIRIELTPDLNGTFPTKDVFVQAACHLARGGKIDLLGTKLNDLVHKNTFQAVTEANTIKGTIIYIDSFGNVVTNITKRLFNDIGNGRPFIIRFKRRGYDINKLCENYNDVIESERLALFGRTGFLEIAINIGHAANLLGLKQNEIIRVEFDV